MKIIVVGNGRLGKGLVSNLLDKGHEVTLIDLKERACKDCKDKERLNVVIGMGFDKDVLERAGIQSSDALVACTNSDETNALIARISKNIYRVPRVIARLFDPNKARIYTALGIQTISTTEWGIQRASEALSFNQLDAVLSIGNGEVEIIRVEVPLMLAGRSVNEVSMVGKIRVVSILRGNSAIVPTDGTLLEQHDVLYISVVASALERLKTLLGL